MKIKTIDVNAKEWFDKVNGNSYFSGEIVVNYQMKNEQTFIMPFQYGYGEMYLQIARDVLMKYDCLPVNEFIAYPLTRCCRENNIPLRHNIKTGCKKKEVENV